MKVVFSPRAERQLKKLRKISQIIVAKKIRSIRDGSSHRDEKLLKGYKNIYRVPIGDFRIVYRKFKNEIYIVSLGHRKDIYRKLGRLFG